MRQRMREFTAFAGRTYTEGAVLRLLYQGFQIGLGLGVGGPDEAALGTGEFGAFSAGGITLTKGAGTDGADGAEADVASFVAAAVAIQFSQ